MIEKIRYNLVRFLISNKNIKKELRPKYADLTEEDYQFSRDNNKKFQIEEEVSQIKELCFQDLYPF